MNKRLNDIRKIAEIDTQIDDKNTEILLVKESYNALIKEKSKLEIKLEDAIENDKKIYLSVAQNNLRIKELGDKIEETSKKSKNIKSEKEMKALSLEEELLKDQLNSANDEIERLEKSKQEVSEEVKKIKESISKLDEEATELSKNTNISVKAINEQLQKISLKKEKTIKDIDQKLVLFYERIRKWAKNTTVVPIRKQACGGCFMVLSDKTYSEAIKNEDIVNCLHCGRILYVENNPETITTNIAG